MGDPAAPEAVRRLTEDLRAALAGPDPEQEAAACLAAAGRQMAAWAKDANPRTRAWARSLVLVASLLGDGRTAEARDFVEGELWRSLPGQGAAGGPG